MPAACGTPSLASDTSALRESVQHAQTGFLFPHGDASALARRMGELAASPDVVERLGRDARQFAEGLSWERTADQTEAHLTEFLGGA